MLTRGITYEAALLAVYPISASELDHVLTRNCHDSYVDRGSGGASRWLSALRGKWVLMWQQLQQRAALQGLQLPELPPPATEPSSWYRTMLGTIGSDADPLALSLGERAFHWRRAWSKAIELAYRIEYCNNTPTDREITSFSEEALHTWRAFDRALGELEHPLIERSRNELAHHLAQAPNLAAPSGDRHWSSIFKKVMHWLEALDRQLQWLPSQLDAPIDAPPSGPPSPEEGRVFAEILKRPEDEALRRQYASLASLRGDARALLIEHQLAEEHDPALKNDLQSTFRIHSHPEWTAPLEALGARKVKFWRGFPDEIEIDIDRLLANHERIFALAPIRTLRIGGPVRGRGAELASIPQLSRLRELAIRGGDYDQTSHRMTDDDVAHILARPLKNLVAFRVPESDVTNIGVEAIARATANMPALEIVDLTLIDAPNPCDRFEWLDETRGIYVPTPEGIALEAKFGPLRWLHEQRQPPVPWIDDERLTIKT